MDERILLCISDTEFIRKLNPGSKKHCNGWASESLHSLRKQYHRGG